MLVCVGVCVCERERVCVWVSVLGGWVRMVVTCVCVCLCVCARARVRFCEVLSSLLTPVDVFEQKDVIAPTKAHAAQASAQHSCEHMPISSTQKFKKKKGKKELNYGTKSESLGMLHNVRVCMCVCVCVCVCKYIF